jgi:hypothetical protein
MRLGLSSAAAPDASLDELLAACALRGLTALELREEDAHGVNGAPGGIDGAEAQRRARAAGVVITGFRSAAAGEDLALARLAAAAGAPVLVAGGCCVTARGDRAAELAAVGADVIVTLQGAIPAELLERVSACRCELGWDVDVDAGRVGTTAARLIAGLGRRLTHILIPGGGPENVMREGRGLGELMGVLALAGYAGTIIMAPSSTRYRMVWQSWLGRRGGTGCGSKQEDPSLVHLESVLVTGGIR